MLALGLASYETAKWAKHRRLINPAFQLEKVKVNFDMMNGYSCSFSVPFGLQ